MIKIKHIEFIKVLYDESLSHHIFSIANIQFSNYPPIKGALLYWKRNNSPKDFTPEGEYKFFYDLKNASYFASVKFPKNVKLTRAQKQELAYILLDERGNIGSYSFKTHANRKHRFQPKRALEKLQLPADFNGTSIPPYIGPIVDDNELEQLANDNPQLTKKQIADYCFWRFHLIKLHPDQFEPFLDYVDFSYICFACDLLTEKYLIDHLDFVDVSTLQYNYPVLSRLSASFKRYMIEELKNQDLEINPHFADEIDLFIRDKDYFSEYGTIQLSDDLDDFDDDETTNYQFFEYDRGPYKWLGSEHMVKGIPSLASQLYDDMGFKKPTNKEMDEMIENYSPKQFSLLSAILEPHWLHRYREILDWSIVCHYNLYLTDEFLIRHLKYLDFDALGNNIWCTVSEEFLAKYIKKFNHEKPVPLIIRHLTEQLYLQYKDTIQINSDLLYRYYDKIDSEQYVRLLELIDE